MYICEDCKIIFCEPKRYIDKHELDTPPYEEFDGCPRCSGTYKTAILCAICGEYITGNYVKLVNGDTICDNCYINCNITD